MTFHVGQKVVCVDAVHQLVNGGIYTISFVGSGRLGAMCDVAEIAGVFPPLAFFQRRFRPIVEKKTDISIFTAMLNPSKQGVDA